MSRDNNVWNYYVFVSFLLITVFVGVGSAATCRAEKIKNNIDTCREVKKLGDYIARKAQVLEDPSEVSVFYSLKDKHVIKQMMPRPWIKPGESLRLPFIGDPCSCNGYTCGCCVGINITAVRFDKTACINVTYDQNNFGFNLDVYIDSQNVYHTSLSAANPPPICFPVLAGGVPTGIDICVRFFQIYLDGFNVHTCIDLEVRIVSAPILVLHFDCIKLGTSGVIFSKPNATTTAKPSDENPITSNPPTDGDTFDPVTEMENANNMTQNNSNNTTTVVLDTLNGDNNANMTQISSEMNTNDNYMNQVLPPMKDMTNETVIQEGVNENVAQIIDNVGVDNVINVTSPAEFNSALNYLVNNYSNLTQKNPNNDDMKLNVTEMLSVDINNRKETKLSK